MVSLVQNNYDSDVISNLKNTNSVKEEEWWGLNSYSKKEKDGTLNKHMQDVRVTMYFTLKHTIIKISNTMVLRPTPWRWGPYRP